MTQQGTHLASECPAAAGASAGLYASGDTSLYESAGAPGNTWPTPGDRPGTGGLMHVQDATHSTPSATQPLSHPSPTDSAAAPEVRRRQVQGQAVAASAPRREAEQRDVQDSRLLLLERQV